MDPIKAMKAMKGRKDHAKVNKLQEKIMIWV